MTIRWWKKPEVERKPEYFLKWENEEELNIVDEQGDFVGWVIDLGNGHICRYRIPEDIATLAGIRLDEDGRMEIKL